MSLRRRACNQCFKSRRKCDFGWPTCETCRRTKKTCLYAYAPDGRIDGARRSRRASNSINDGLIATGASSINPAQVNNERIPTLLETDVVTHYMFDQYGQSLEFGAFSNPDQSVLDMMTNTNTPSTPPSVPDLLGPLGEIQPLLGSTQSWQWVVDQLKSYPREFAQRAETLFIHRELYCDSMPRPIRAAFGVSSTYCFINDNNCAMLFKIIDAEILELFSLADGMTLLEELARLQAAVLYQTIRLFHGNMEQRTVAEQQQEILMNWSLKLLARSKVEIDDSGANDWRAWILSESIRRTALIVYMLYGVNSICKQGICIGFPTLTKLPVSTTLAAWSSQAGHQLGFRTEATIPYETFTALWLVSTPRRLDPFEKLLLVPCKGIDTITAYHQSALLEV